MHHLQIELLRLASDREQEAMTARAADVRVLPAQRAEPKRRLAAAGSRMSVVALAAFVAALLPWYR